MNWFELKEALEKKGYGKYPINIDTGEWFLEKEGFRDVSVEDAEKLLDQYKIIHLEDWGALIEEHDIPYLTIVRCTLERENATHIEVEELAYYLGEELVTELVNNPLVDVRYQSDSAFINIFQVARLLTGDNKYRMLQFLSSDLNGDQSFDLGVGDAIKMVYPNAKIFLDEAVVKL